MAISVRPKRRVGRAAVDISRGWCCVAAAGANGPGKGGPVAATPGHPVAASRPVDHRRQPNGCNPLDTSQSPPECVRCCHRPESHGIDRVGSMQNVLVATGAVAATDADRFIHPHDMLPSLPAPVPSVRSSCSWRRQRKRPPKIPLVFRRNVTGLRRPSGSLQAQWNRLGNRSVGPHQSPPDGWLQAQSAGHNAG